MRAHQQKVNFAGFLFVRRKGTFCEPTLFKNTITTKIQPPLQEISSLGILLSFKREEIEPKSSHPRCDLGVCLPARGYVHMSADTFRHQISLKLELLTAVSCLVLGIQLSLEEQQVLLAAEPFLQSW